MIHGYQDSRNAMTKNAIKLCRLKKALTPSHFETSPPIESRSYAVSFSRWDYGATTLAQSGGIFWRQGSHFPVDS
jgi:hypothetical protein